MNVHNLKQGSTEWHAFRADRDTASEASAMMGACSKTTRNELLHMKATGTKKQFSEWAQRFLLDNGHAVEAASRPKAAELVGEKLYPVTAESDEYPGLAASFDGITMLESTIWECKSWNEQKAVQVRDGSVPEEDYWQVVQQMVISRAERCLYTLSDGGTKFLHCWFTLNKRDEKRLLAGWEQFNIDREAYVYVEPKAEVIAAPVARLPAITYKLNGLVLTSNLDVFRAAAEQAVIDSRKELNTDQEFADRDALNKAFGEAETKIRLMREQVLGEFQDLNTFTIELGEIGELIRQARLAGEKQVAARKESIKLELRNNAIAAWGAHIQGLNARLGPRIVMPPIAADFAGVMKGKRSIKGIQDALDNELARCKIEGNELANKLEANVLTLREKVAGFEFLFRDAQELVEKDAETLALIIKDRLEQHAAAEEKRLTEEREKIRLEEQTKLQLEADEKARAEALSLEDDEPYPAMPPATENPHCFTGELGVVDDVHIHGEPVFGMDHASGPDRTVELTVGKICGATRFEGEEYGVLAIDTQTTPALVTRTEVVNMLALVQAIARGEAPINVLMVDLDRLADACHDAGHALPGTTWGGA